MDMGSVLQESTVAQIPSQILVLGGDLKELRRNGVEVGVARGGGQVEGFEVRKVLLAVDGRICDARVGDGHDSSGPARCAGL